MTDEYISDDFSFGYPTFAPSASQIGIIQRAGELWLEAISLPLKKIERDFIAAFFEMRGQRSVPDIHRSRLATSASMVEDIIALYLAYKKISVSLITPCLDSIHDILVRAGVAVSPIAENLLHDPTQIYNHLAEYVTGDCLYLVAPNNPTGAITCLRSQDAFREMLRFASDHNKTLILDLCFASLVKATFDVYAMLEESGVSYFTIEDTGKIFPTADQKVAILTCSATIFSDPELQKIYLEKFFGGLRIIARVVTEFCRDAMKTEHAHILGIVTKNRECLAQHLRGTQLELVQGDVDIPFAWLRIKHPRMTSAMMQEKLLAYGIKVWGGNQFYWGDTPEEGDTYIRIALSRDPEKFAQGMRALKTALADMQLGLTTSSTAPAPVDPA